MRTIYYIIDYIGQLLTLLPGTFSYIYEVLTCKQNNDFVDTIVIYFKRWKISFKIVLFSIIACNFLYENKKCHIMDNKFITSGWRTI
jgi:hypothetical protein